MKRKKSYLFSFWFVDDDGSCLHHWRAGAAGAERLLLVLRRTGIAWQINLKAPPVDWAVILEGIEEVDEVEACMCVIDT